MAFDDLFKASKDRNNNANKIPERDNPTNYYFAEFDNKDRDFSTRRPVFIVIERKYWDDHKYIDYDNSYMPPFLRAAGFQQLEEQIYDYQGNGAPYGLLAGLGCKENKDLLDAIGY